MSDPGLPGKLGKIKTKVELEEEDDPHNILSDEEIAWKLHQELNAGSPVLRTRSSRSRGASNLTEAGSDTVAGTTEAATANVPGPKNKKSLREKKTTVEKKESAGLAQKRSGLVAKSGVAPPRRSPRAVDGSTGTVEKGVNKDIDEKKNGKNGNDRADLIDKGLVDGPRNNPESKARSRKGKPRVAADGVQPERVSKKRGRSESKSAYSQGKRPAPKIPKLPMVQQGGHWYRARVLEETVKDILVEFAGYEGTLPSTRLPKYSERVWMGSYKGKDWRYHGDGAWIPKNGIRNRTISVEDYDIHEESVDMERHEMSNNPAERNTNVPYVDTPDLLPDLLPDGAGGTGGTGAGADEGKISGVKRLAARTTSGPTDPLSHPKKKKLPGGGRSAKDLSTKGRPRKGASSESAKRNSGEDSVGIQKPNRPRRNTRKTALFSNPEFALDIDGDVDVLDSDGAFTDNAYHLAGSEGTNQSMKRNQFLNMSMGTLDEEEQEALEALAEMPSSPACRFHHLRSEEMLEDSREALLEAYSNGNGHGKTSEKRTWKRSYRSEPNLGQSSRTTESIMIAGRVFGGLMRAVSARIGNGIQRTISMPPTQFARAQGKRWSPHVWTSGVTPANAEPAIIQVPSSLIQKALVSPRYKSDALDGKMPPVPLFH
jgi:hypothetical protein